MTIILDPTLEAALNERAQRYNVSPESLALNALQEKFNNPPQLLNPQDEWERMLLDIGTDCGVSLSHEELSSEGLYE